MIEHEAPRFDRSSDWLSSCQGFRLEAAGKRLGVVEEVLFGDDHAPAALLVQGRLFGTRAFIIPVENVVEVVPRSKRIVIGDDRSGSPA